MLFADGLYLFDFLEASESCFSTDNFIVLAVLLTIDVAGSMLSVCFFKIINTAELFLFVSIIVPIAWLVC